VFGIIQPQSKAPSRRGPWEKSCFRWFLLGTPLNWRPDKVDCVFPLTQTKSAQHIAFWSLPLLSPLSQKGASANICLLRRHGPALKDRPALQWQNVAHCWAYLLRTAWSLYSVARFHQNLIARTRQPITKTLACAVEIQVPHSNPGNFRFLMRSQLAIPSKWPVPARGLTYYLHA